MTNQQRMNSTHQLTDGGHPHARAVCFSLARVQPSVPRATATREKRVLVRKQREEILAKLYASNPEAKEKIKKAAGYGTFNNKSMNLFLLSTGHGYGVVMDKSGKETFMAMGSIGGGVGLGAKDLAVVFIFKNDEVRNKFVESGWQFGGEADATAKAGEKGAAASKEIGVDTGANLLRSTK
jgi:lipid-binding SYLF domain-containing protein